MADFAVTGALVGYTVVPSLAYQDDIGNWLPLPAGSLVTTSGFSFTHPTITTVGQHTVSVRDASAPAIVGTSGIFSVSLANVSTKGIVPATLPQSFAIGLALQPSEIGWAVATGVPWGFAQQYLTSGVNTTNGWAIPGSSWGPDYAFNYATSAQSHGYLPVFTYYQIYPSLPNGNGVESDSDYRNLNNTLTMRAYYSDFTIAMQQSARTARPVLMHVEPDLFGFMKAMNPNPTLITASVASSGNTDVSAFPNTFAGFCKALLHLRDVYAPNVIMAAHVSEWQWTSNTSPTFDVRTVARTDATFFNALGPWDLFFTDITDRDAAFYQFVLGDGGAHWWSLSNNTFPNFNSLSTWADTFTTLVQRRLLVWQIPLGNTIMRTMNNTSYHYQDNRAQYWLENYPTNTGIASLAAAGVIGLIFGAGADHCTRSSDWSGDGTTNPAAINGNNEVSVFSDDDGGYLRLRVGNYYRTGAAHLL